MSSDQETVRRHEAWFESPRGRFALSCELHLVDMALADWPRRNQKLLDIGCGLGLFLEEFWRAGFDVTGQDKSPAMLEAARRRLGSRADFHLGHAEHLPFDDNEFDYAALVTVLEFCPDPGAVIREAARVAKKGLLVAALNRWSLHGLRRCRDATLNPVQGTWRSWPETCRLITAHAGRRPAFARSTLPGPAWTWRDRTPFRQFNRLTYPPFAGTFVVARVDFTNQRPLTPIRAWATEPGLGGA